MMSSHLIASHPSRPWRVTGSDGLSLAEIDLRSGALTPPRALISSSSADRICRLALADEWIGLMTRERGFLAINNANKDEAMRYDAVTGFAFHGDSVMLLEPQRAGVVPLDRLMEQEPDWHDTDRRCKSPVLSLDHLAFHEAFLCTHEGLSSPFSDSLHSPISQTVLTASWRAKKDGTVRVCS